MKLWENAFHQQINEYADHFNSSISFDSVMYRQDILGSVAHATMLAQQGIISDEDCKLIVDGLKGILADIDNGTLKIDMSAEDIHSFVEGELVSRIGDAGKRVHTARSRNDQVALDIRMYLKEQTDIIVDLLISLQNVLLDKADAYKDIIMPGYTHLQRAQPVTFGHYIMAYAMMFLRDIDRLRFVHQSINVLPLGSCALAGTSFNIDREKVAKLLGFDRICQNSMDGVSDRDFCVELLSALSLIMMHLSRFSEEIILWSSSEFGFVKLDDGFSTGSSIMPQKKNPDIAELVRGKTGRVYGDLTALLTVLKGLPLAYNKDMQEDKEAVFDAVDTVKMCLTVFTPMIETLKPNISNMRAAAAKGFINATDCADYLTAKGLPFRTAYKITGEIVGFCTENDLTLEEMPLDDYKRFSSLFENDIYDAVNLENCVKKRVSLGGAFAESVSKQIDYVKEELC